MTTLTINTGISTTLKSAQSKKCRLLQKVANHSLHSEPKYIVKIAIAIKNADPLLSSVLTDDQIKSAFESGSRPGRGHGGSNRIQISLD